MRFSPEEDVRLSQIVARHGATDWSSIALYMGSRNARQCRERWCSYLDPALRSSEWTAEEDQLLEKKFREVGPKWNKISQDFIGRSDIALRNRYHVLGRRAAKATMRQPSEPLSEETSDVVAISATPDKQPESSLSLLWFFDSAEREIDFFTEDPADLWGPRGF
jgi:hypothetical protein